LHHIGSYNIEFKYINGEHNELADVLSRAAVDLKARGKEGTA
jgi:hypothetical protein